MPRKKKELKNVKYYMPIGIKEKIDQIVDSSIYYKNKPLWKQKFYHLIEYIAFQNVQNELDLENEFVNVHQATMAAILGTTNQQIATMLRDVVKSGLLIKDGIWKAAIISRQGKKINYIKEGKSYGYQFADLKELIEVEIADNRRIHEKIQINTWKETGECISELRLYHEILTDVDIDVTGIGCKILEVLCNKQKKKSQKENYMEFIKDSETKYKQNNYKLCTTIPFDGKFVPVCNSKTVSPYLHSFQGGKSVPCQPCTFEFIRFQKQKRKAKEVSDELVQTTITRCKRAVYKINNGLMLPNRPDSNSRVYCDITNLNRELRKAIRLDGKKIVGIDLRNSQPLIASILIRNYWLEKSGELPEDVQQYQNDCEHGIFYDEFMKAINLPGDLRDPFKADFFQKVFFSKVIEKKNMLKDMFIKKYPSVWEAICDEKGGLYCTDFNEFAIKLQQIEAAIIFDFVNVGLIRQGIKAFNIYDSIYVNNRNDLEIAKKLIIQGFNATGVNPSLKIEYGEHLAENEQEDTLGLQHQPEIIAEYKPQEIPASVQNEEFTEEELLYIAELDKITENRKRYQKEQEEIRQYYLYRGIKK